MSIHQQFGETVRYFRQLKGMTQEDLSHITKLTRSHISQIECGKFKVQLDTVEVLAQGLRISLFELFEQITIEDIFSPGDTL
jgi:transcriptional regulator with XRE-family HTH domain